MSTANTNSGIFAPATPLQQAMQLHQQGQLDAAAQLYQRVPDTDPQRADALHLHGVLCAQRQDFKQAQALIWQAITRNPGEAMFHNNLANVCVELGQLAAAEPLYVRAIELDGGRIDALSNLGLLLSRTGRADDAERLLRRAVELAPENTDFRQNLANQYMRMGRPSDALQQCHDGLVRTPRSRVLRGLLVLAYNTLGHRAEAEAVLRAWIASDPADPYPRHHLAGCTGEAVPERAADAYVAGLFDGFAGSFDAKLADLSYQAPQQVAGALARRAGATVPALQVLDAGCGTGLCGPLLAAHTHHLTGVDLSEGMLRIAHGRGCYDELFQGELVAFLASRPAGFDAVVSADTLCYFGVLDGFATAAQAALRPAGWLVFTVEALADDAPEAARPGHRLHPHGRYSHARAHVLAVLQGAGFAGLLAEPVVLRNEGGQPVQGWLVSAQRPH
jgi:predicted TPR repeat methyltransferase